jgi:hypothetical protein
MLIAVATYRNYTFSIEIEHNIEENTSFNGKWYAKPKHMSREAENEWFKMRAGLEQFKTSPTITSWTFDTVDTIPTKGMSQKVISAIDRRYPGLQDQSHTALHVSPTHQPPTDDEDAI